MNFINDYSINIKGYGKFIYHLNLTLYKYDSLSAKCKKSENGIIIILSDKTNTVKILVPFDYYNKIVECLTLRDYSSICIRQFDRFILEVAYNEFYNTKFI